MEAPPDQDWFSSNAPQPAQHAGGGEDWFQDNSPLTSTSTVPVRTGTGAPPDYPTVMGGLTNFVKGAYNAAATPVRGLAMIPEGVRALGDSATYRGMWPAAKEAAGSVRDTARQFAAAPVDNTLKTIYDDPFAFGMTAAGVASGASALAERAGVSGALTAARGVGTPSTVAGARARGSLPPVPAGNATDAYAAAQDAIVQRGGAAKAAAQDQYRTALAGPLGDVRVPTGQLLEPPPTPTPVDATDMAKAAVKGSGAPGDTPYILHDTGTEGFRAATNQQRAASTPVFDRLKREGKFGTPDSRVTYSRETTRPELLPPPVPAADAPIPETVSFRDAHAIKGEQTPFRQQGVAPSTPKDRLALQGRREIEGRMMSAAKEQLPPNARVLDQYQGATAAYKDYMNTFERGPAKAATKVTPAKFNEFMLHPEQWNPSTKATSAVRYEPGELPRKMRPDEVIGQFKRAAGPEAWSTARQHLQAELLNQVTTDGVIDGQALKDQLTRLDRHGVTDRLLPNAADLRAYAEKRISQAQFQKRMRAAAKIGGVAVGGLLGSEVYRNYDRIKELF